MFTATGWDPDLIRNNYTKAIVSRYIPNPLLIHGYKFDLRLYVVVTSWNPLRIYFYNEGLARFATEKYSLSENTVQDVFMHLTNYAVNKKNTKFVKNKTGDEELSASKWSLTALKKFLAKDGVNVDRLMNNIKDLLVKTFISVDPHVSRVVADNVQYRGNCFELFGFDVLIDTDLNPWLIEVNLSPSLGCDSPLDLRIKSGLLADMYNMVGVEPFGYSELAQKAAEIKVQKTPKQVEREILEETYSEFERMKNFERLYPTTESHIYSDFFLTKKRLNQLVLDHLRRDEQARTIDQIMQTASAQQSKVRVA
jgi:tubulin polyglutamylase TTLL5